METPIIGKTGEARRLERIVGRQKLKKSYTYEVKWIGMDHRVRCFLPYCLDSRADSPFFAFCRATFTFPESSSSTSASPSSSRSTMTSRRRVRDPDHAR